MRTGFVLSLGVMAAAGVCFTLAQSEHIGKTLPSEKDIQVLPTLKIGHKNKEPVNKEAVTELPPLVVTIPEKTPSASPIPTAALAGDLPAPSFRAEPARNRIWGTSEYLLWWVQKAPVSVPLATGNNDPSTFAALNEPGTTILWGAGSDHSTSYGPFSGGRITVGGWMGEDQRFGLEGSGFLLEERSILFAAASAGGSAPVVSIPFYSTTAPAGETSLNSGGHPGINAPNVVLFRDTSQCWGAEANGLYHLVDSDRFRLAALAGFRYLDLVEDLSLTDTFIDTTSKGQLTVSDSFGTRNQFYGGQIGARGGVSLGRWQLDVTGKVAFGSNHQVSTVAGGTLVSGGAFGFPNTVTSSGLFAEPSNVGRLSRNVFAVVPEVQFQLGYQAGQHLHPFIGYNFLYLSDALRPGNQIDRNINVTQNAFFDPPGTLKGPAAPVAVFHSSDFWAQGINFGLEIRF